MHNFKRKNNYNFYQLNKAFLTCVANKLRQTKSQKCRNNINETMQIIQSDFSQIASTIPSTVVIFLRCQFPEIIDAFPGSPQHPLSRRRHHRCPCRSEKLRSHQDESVFWDKQCGKISTTNGNRYAQLNHWLREVCSVRKVFYLYRRKRA